jgi:acyl-CoA thioesterase FadM
LGGEENLAKFEFLPTSDWNFWGYAVPIIVGFLLGPWLDLQQWQRAIQMHRERISIAGAYAVGSLQFFLLLLFHGTLALWALGQGAGDFLRTGLSGHSYHHDGIMRFLVRQAGEHPWLFGAYCVFIAGCLLTTLDSGYIALRWFLQSALRSSNNALLAIIPQGLLTSPIPIFGLAGLVALLGAILNLEIEYFMIFYATFFVGYSGLAIARCYINTPANVIPQVKMFCIGSLAVVIFAYGYFLRYPAFMIIGSMLPLAYLLWTLLKPTSGEEFVSGTEELSTGPAEGGHRELTPHRYTQEDPGATPGTRSVETAGDTEKGGSIARMAAPALAAIESLQNVGGHFEGKWFVHSFVSTYADTNSVGNVYFGMYAMWVGKTRELFFNRVMPKFNLKNTPFYILTRSFEHKFIRETREFETVSVRIRIASYNRKFVVLEHEIYDSAQKLLGKGKQSLLFVSSTDYHMIDLPTDVTAAFLAHT